MVKGVHFGGFRDVGHPVSTAKVYDAQGADELLFLDITANQEDRGILFEVIEKTAEACFMPLTVGGGVRTLDDIRQLLLAGADKVSINTEAVRQPEFVRDASARFGSQCVVVSIDVQRRRCLHAQRDPALGADSGRVGAAGGGAWRRRNHHHVDRSRRDAHRLRPGVDPGGRRRRDRSRRRFRRRRDAAGSRRRRPRRACVGGLCREPLPFHRSERHQGARVHEARGPGHADRMSVLPGLANR